MSTSPDQVRQRFSASVSSCFYGGCDVIGIAGIYSGSGPQERLTERSIASSRRLMQRGPAAVTALIHRRAERQQQLHRTDALLLTR